MSYGSGCWLVVSDTRLNGLNLYKILRRFLALTEVERFVLSTWNLNSIRTSWSRTNMPNLMYVRWIVYELRQRMLISRVGYSVKRLKFVQNIAPISSAHRSQTVRFIDLKFTGYPRDAVSYKTAKFHVHAASTSWVIRGYVRSQHLRSSPLIRRN